MSRSVAAAIGVACLLSVPVAAHASGWPMLGGDAGHSGHQALETPVLPAAFAWHVGGTDQPRTGAVLTSAKAAADRRLVYGTYGGGEARVHIREVADGDETVAEDEQAVSPDADAFGDAGEAVTPVDTSGEQAGQLFVLHNEEDAAARAPAPDCVLLPGTTASSNDLAIAQYDVATGDLVFDAAIGPAAGNSLCPSSQQPPVTDGYRVDSSPVLSPPLGSTGTRSLFFVARPDSGTGPGRLFKLDIPRPQDRDSGIDVVAPEYREIEALNSKASPTVALLTDPDTGQTAPFVLVSRTGTGSDIVGYRADDLEGGAAIRVTADIPGDPQTVTVPTGEDGGLASPAPAVYAAYADGGKTKVRAFVQDGGDLTAPIAPRELDGTPAPGMAGDGEALYVTTSSGLFRLNAGTLAPEATSTGETFAQNLPLVSGGLVFAQADDGSHVVLTDGLESVGSGFTETSENAGATSAVGQPAYAAGALAFLTSRGASLYRTGIAPPPPPDDDGDGDGDGGGGPEAPNQAPTATFIFAPNPGKAGELVGFDASGSKDPDGSIARYEWDLDGNGSFETDGGAKPGMLGIYPAGVHNVRLRVTDDRGATAEAARQITVIGTVVKRERLRPDSVVFSVSPRRDRRKPFRFTVRGRMTVPAGVDRTAACRGRVSVSVKRGKRRVLVRTPRMRRDCTFTSRLRFRNRKRLGRARKLRVVSRFAGNRVLLPRQARSRTIRVR